MYEETIEICIYYFLLNRVQIIPVTAVSAGNTCH